MSKKVTYASKIKKKKTLIPILMSALLLLAMGSTVLMAINNWDFQKLYNKIGNDKSNGYPSYVVNNYSKNNPNISEDVATLDEMKLATKEWFEYVDYSLLSQEKDDDGNTYKIYAPADYASSSIMAVRDFNPNQLSGKGNVMDCYWRDMAVMFANIAAANGSVVIAGGIQVGIAGLLRQEAVAVGAAGLITGNTDILKKAPYYASPEFMGIPNNDKWNGISNSGFYSCNSLSISMSASETFNVVKTNSTDSTYSVGGSSSLSTQIRIFGQKIGGSITTNASSALKYGVNYQQGQSMNNSYSVSRTFSARQDAEVKDVGWKLVEYVVRVPYKIEVFSDEDDGLIATSYVTQDLLKGVCRVFANGYIEHWNTGKLVNYADFFEGFVTAKELIEKAKNEIGGQ